MSNIIDKIRISGVTYDIQGSGGGGSPTVELTQAEYDALVTAGTVSQNTYYIITDATAGDLTQYWTSAQTQSAITSAVSEKASQSDLETVSGQVANKQDTLVSGTNIKTINNESILGSGNIDIQGGGVTVDSAFSRTSENPVQNKVISNNATNGDGTVSSSSGIYKWEFYSVGGVGTNKGFFLDTINGDTVVKKYNNTRSLQLVETSAITTSITSGSTDAQVPSAKAVNDKLGGLTVVKLTESEYTALVTKDSNTLYVVVPDPSN